MSQSIRQLSYAFRPVGAVMVAVLLLTVALVAPAADPVRILAFGDSLTAGLGLPSDESFPAQLEQALQDAGTPVEVINAGVSGDTTAGGRARLDWVLADEPDAVILALGANDGLRGLDPAITQENLDAILTGLAERGLPVLLAGMYAPPNLGSDYGERFNALYPELAERHGVVFYPFFLEGVAARPALNQDDGIHPTAAGVALMVEQMLPQVRQLLERVE